MKYCKYCVYTVGQNKVCSNSDAYSGNKYLYGSARLRIMKKRNSRGAVTLVRVSEAACNQFSKRRKR